MRAFVFPSFVFYEGPPTANGMPHNGHVLTRVMKDVFPRYKTMQGLPRPAQGRLGHARPARRGRGREGARHPRQGRDRGLRRRALHPPLHRVGVPLHRRVGEAHRAHRLLGRPRRRPTSPTTRATSRACGGRSRALQEGPALPGPQGGLVVGPGRHRALGGRGRPGLQDRRRSRRSSCASRWWARSRPAYLAWTTTPWTLPSNVALAVRPSKRRLTRRRSDRGRRGASFVIAAAWPRRSSGPPPTSSRRQGQPSSSASATSRPSATRRPRTARRTRSSPRTSSPSIPARASSTSRPPSAKTTSGCAARTASAFCSS
jgi:hypothetical protein